MTKLLKKMWFGSGVVVNGAVARVSRRLGLDTYALFMEILVDYQRRLANDEMTVAEMFEELV